MDVFLIISKMWDHMVLFLILISSFTYFSKKLDTEHLWFNWRRLKFNLFFFTLYSICLVLAFFSLPLFLVLPRSIWNLRHCAQVMKHLTILCDIRWELRNGAILSEKGGAVIVANHQHSLDTLGMFTIWDKIYKLTPIAKKDFLYALPFGFAMYLAGVVFIDSNKKEESFKKLDNTAKNMLLDQAKVWIFPEGRRNPDCKKFLPFKKGAFHMAVSAQVPIIPVIFSPYYFIDDEKCIFDKGRVILQCLDPIPTEGLTKADINELIERVQDKMTETYKNLADEVTQE